MGIIEGTKEQPGVKAGLSDRPAGTERTWCCVPAHLNPESHHSSAVPSICEIHKEGAPPMASICGFRAC